ncbi:hypothetical protein NLJ89_g345 [Agrocybe chaxingu]|uniref:Uncharacterized protein n=1 Tax=Agrocybe chaxingu TaxID=84603 RepID=A0A9W8N207_9AGAR|nr:hypothetical protein NLJ89_g345 [Agrocybe chaxingu]
MTSSIISQWPWASGALTQSENLEEIVDPAKDLQDFARALTSCEKRLLSWAGGEREVRSLQSLIGIQVNTCQALTPIQAGHTNNNADQTRLCSVISGYQLLARNPHPDICKNPPYEAPRTGVIPAKLPPGYDKLENWVDMLFDVKKLLGDFRAPVNISTQRAPERLTSYIRHFQRQGDCAKIIVNMLAAALHLAFLRENEFQHGEIPDIPENIEKMSDDSPYKLPLMSLLEGLSARAKQGSVLRLPLHLALLISPLYLLVPVQLLKNPFGREAVMQLSVCLGNMKGPLLRLVEDEIMVTEARLAELDVDPLEELRSLFSRIPWESLRHCDVRERFFFRFEPETLIEEAPVQPLPPPPPPAHLSTPAAVIQRGTPPSMLPPLPPPSRRQPIPGVETVGERFRLILRGDDPAAPCPTPGDNQGSRLSSSLAERQVEPVTDAEEGESDMNLESSYDEEPSERRGIPGGLNGSPEVGSKEPKQDSPGKSVPPKRPSAEAASLPAARQGLDESGVNQEGGEKQKDIEQARSFVVEETESSEVASVGQRDDSPATEGRVVIDMANMPSDDEESSELSSVGDDDSERSSCEDGTAPRSSGRRAARATKFKPLFDKASSDSTSAAEDSGSESRESQGSGPGLNDNLDGPATWRKMPESSQGRDSSGEAGASGPKGRQKAKAYSGAPGVSRTRRGTPDRR